MEDENGELTAGTLKELQDDHNVVGDYYLNREAVDKWMEGVIQEMLPTGKDSSGRLTKYPLAVVNKLLDVFGTCISGGYDIGCKFGTMLANSPLGPHACKLEYKSLYVEGLGPEDLEGCEWFFFKSNALALSIQYASTFHHKQSIQEYAKHMVRQETYATLSTFLVNNYKQALQLINGLPALEKQMKDQGVMGLETFKQWLAEEKAYLQGLSWKALDDAQAKWLVITPNFHNVWDYKRSTEMKHHHVLENHNKIVQDLETKLGITTQWTQTNPEWRVVAEMAGKHCYQQCLDDLEALVGLRMFELTKMNMLQMVGYKLRKHIGKALKAQSQAICNALGKYNAAAHALSPPCPELSWDLVMEYVFLVTLTSYQTCVEMCMNALGQC
ncbi:hypothetical protein C0989_008515 [Termitomyces sp. Mn162]|nr:hypothetical protein C0989_008515 [Termitomyces sp. Mn162]